MIRSSLSGTVLGAVLFHAAFGQAPAVTVAGGGQSDGAPAIGVALGVVNGLAADSAGNVYIFLQPLRTVFISWRQTAPSVYSLEPAPSVFQGMVGPR